MMDSILCSPIPAISRSHIRASRQSSSLDVVGFERGIKFMSQSVRMGVSAFGLPSILFAYLGMRMLEISDGDWDVASPLHSTGVPLAPLLS